MRNQLGFIAAVVLLALVAVSWGQTGNRSGENSPGSYGILPPQAYLTDRDSSLERELKRLQDARAGMGINHPKLADVERRIRDLEAELETFRAIPNPFQRFEDKGISPRDIVEQLSEEELRILVVRLAVDVKDLRERVAALERFNPSR
jgi:hypothetical protein